MNKSMKKALKSEIETIDKQIKHLLSEKKLIENELNKEKKPKRIHLISSGDSFFGASEYACGKKPLKGDMGSLECDPVTCSNCQNSKLYKKLDRKVIVEEEFQ